MTVMKLEVGVLGLCGRNTAKGAPGVPLTFPGNSWGGTLLSWCILLLFEIPAPPALCFPTGRRWVQSSLGTLSWPIRQQGFLVWLDEKFRSTCSLCALGGPAITEWLRVSESAAWVCAHALKCVGLSSSFGTQFYFLRKQEGISSRSDGLCIIFT